MQNLWIIPALPLLGFVINGIFGRKLPKAAVSLIAVLSVVLSFAYVLKVIASSPLDSPLKEHYYTWIKSGAFELGWDYAVDKLTMIMLLVVTGIGSLIHIYSVGYMDHEEGYWRFFAYLNLFMAFMLNLVLAANYLILFVGWEGVGLCSYLLIGFYFHKKSATDAGNKAFIVNRIGDFGFSLAMFLIVVNFGSLDFQKVFTAAPGKPEAVLTSIALLLLVGAAGKSAQFPLYIWLPDAMEGPTPVSALIHAATMVTAGVYVCARSAAIFSHAPIAMQTVAVIGLFTAVFAATIGLAQNDIKKVFAYSTVSQLGYMFLGVGVGAYSAGVWHLVTHAFFKALLFLGAGSVIHACHGEQDMRRMGGLRKFTPITFATLACGSLAIAGFPFTSGFYSKDAILVAAHAYAPWMYWVGTATAGLTAFYVWRAFFMTFFGEYKGHAKPHESPLSMTAPLMILALLSIVGGYFFNVPEILGKMFQIEKEAAGSEMLMYISVAAGLVGIAAAYFFYVVSPGLPAQVAKAAGGLYILIYNKYFVDEAVDATIIQPTIGGSRALLWKFMDVGVIDGIVNGVGGNARGLGGVLRQLQSGNIRSYATWVVLGSVALLLVMGVFAMGGGR